MTETTTTFRDFLAELGLTQTELSRRFNIPLRTVQDWAGERRSCPPYVRTMIAELCERETRSEEKNRVIE